MTLAKLTAVLLVFLLGCAFSQEPFAPSVQGSTLQPPSSNISATAENEGVLSISNVTQCGCWETPFFTVWVETAVDCTPALCDGWGRIPPNGYVAANGFLTGPDVPCCDRFDVDQDGDVDLRDLASYQRYFPNWPWRPPVLPQ